MKNIFLKSIGVLAATVFAAGCVQETLPQGSTQLSKTVASTPGATESILRGIPSSMNTANTAGYYRSYEVHTDFGIGGIHLMNEFMLNDLATCSDNPYYNRFYPQAMNRSQGSRYIYCAYYWTCYYQWIKTANDVISLLANNTTESQKPLLGQAYAYRAMFYLDLARLFEAKPVTDPYALDQGYNLPESVLGLTVPIVTPDLDEKKATNNPRASREDMYAFILGDLDKAAELLAGQTFDYTTPSVVFVDGLRARAYIEMGYWGGENEKYFAEAAKYARQAITEGNRSPLTKAQWKDVTNGFNNGKTNNSWVLGQTLATENVVNLLSFTAHISSEATWGYAPLSMIGADRKFYEAIPDTDFRKDSWLSPEFIDDPDNPKWDDVYKFCDKEIFVHGSTKLNMPAAVAYENIKFRPYQGKHLDDASGNIADMCLMRIEEMYFIEAEALAHSEGLAQGKNALETFIKANRNPEYTCNASNLETFLKDDLLFQKRVEFWGEGILLYDFKRLDVGINRGYLGTNHASVYRLNCQGRSPEWNFVITRGEFQSNTGINDATNNPDPSDKVELWIE